MFDLIRTLNRKLQEKNQYLSIRFKLSLNQLFR